MLDFLYGKELEEYVADGTLNELHAAISVRSVSLFLPFVEFLSIYLLINLCSSLFL